MTVMQRSLQLGWLAITVALIAVHIWSHQPFKDAMAAAVLLGLIALSVRALLNVWRWADLAWRKVWLWLSNSSVNWTMEVRIAAPDPIEDADITVLHKEICMQRSADRVSRPNGSDTIAIETAQNYSLSIRPMQSGHDAWWILHFAPVHIGYRDASHILQRKFIPVIDDIVAKIEDAGERMYAIEARFSTINPYAAVLLNELRVDFADQVLLTFKQDGATVQLTKECIIASCTSQADAIYSMSTVFGLSLRGALSVGHV